VDSSGSHTGGMEHWESSDSAGGGKVSLTDATEGTGTWARPGRGVGCIGPCTGCTMEELRVPGNHRVCSMLTPLSTPQMGTVCRPPHPLPRIPNTSPPLRQILRRRPDPHINTHDLIHPLPLPRRSDSVPLLPSMATIDRRRPLGGLWYWTPHEREQCDRLRRRRNGRPLRGGTNAQRQFLGPLLPFLRRRPPHRHTRDRRMGESTSTSSTRLWNVCDEWDHLPRVDIWRTAE
jgi:hypothetical protein